MLFYRMLLKLMLASTPILKLLPKNGILFNMIERCSLILDPDVTPLFFMVTLSYIYTRV